MVEKHNDYQIFSTKEKEEEFVSLIKNYFSFKVLSITIIGSRAKNLHSDNSDFDLRVILMNNIKNYIFQRVSKTYPIDTFINIDEKRVQIEGKAIDLTSAFNFAFKTNSFAAEIIKGNTIYQDEEYNIIKLLKEAYVDCFNYKTAIFQLNGLLISEFQHCAISSKKFKTGDLSIFEKDIKAKNLCEVNYLFLSLEYLLENKLGWLDIQRIDDLLSSNLTILTDQFKEYTQNILSKRRENKSQKLTKSNEIFNLIFKRMDMINQSWKDSYLEKEDEGHQARVQKYEDIVYSIILKSI